MSQASPSSSGHVRKGSAQGGAARASLGRIEQRDWGALLCASVQQRSAWRVQGLPMAGHEQQAQLCKQGGLGTENAGSRRSSSRAGWPQENGGEHSSITLH